MSKDSDERLQASEERIAHLTRTVDDLSDLLREQGRQIERLQAQLAHLIEREAEREAESGASVTLGDEKPPHW
ncbi:MAG: SlyX family protein [Pararhodobacter sp.]|nr:SlyX family protein [Pararhodobacter sp.]